MARDHASSAPMRRSRRAVETGPRAFRLPVRMPRADFWSETTVRARRFKSPLLAFLRTESGGAAVLVAATAAALIWVNVDTSSYEGLWRAVLAIDINGDGIAL